MTSGNTLGNSNDQTLPLASSNPMVKVIDGNEIALSDSGLSINGKPKRLVKRGPDGKRLVLFDARGKAKPRMRGYFHLCASPLVLASGIVLMSLASTPAILAAMAVFTFCSTALFTTSAIYHFGNWSERTSKIFRRFDHANIFLLIAGTYTPLALLTLPTTTARLILAIVWSGAGLGLVFHMFWIKAPRWIFVPIYVAIGCVAFGFLGSFWQYAGPAITVLILAGGVAYITGAVFYAIKKPTMSLRWFGFHELFHVLTIVGFACHTVAIVRNRNQIVKHIATLYNNSVSTLTTVSNTCRFINRKHRRQYFFFVHSW
jgi:hemolysin III